MRRATHAALAQLEAESGKDADFRTTQTSTRLERQLAVNVLQMTSVQHINKNATLASHFRCHNQGCSVAYSKDVSVHSTELKSCARCCKWRTTRWSARLWTERRGMNRSAARGWRWKKESS